MCSKIEETLSLVAEDVFEELTFILVMPDDGSMEHDDREDSPDWVAGIRFQGPFSGALFLRATEDLAPMIASNMLGLEDGEEPVPGQIEDAFKELLNVICGNLLPRLVGDEPVFAVKDLELISGSGVPEKYDGRPPLASTRISLEIGRAALTFFASDDTLGGALESETSPVLASAESCDSEQPPI